MRTKSIVGKKLILMGLLAFTLLIPNSAGAEPDFNKFVVFGTSLSDPGNFFSETKDVNVPPNYDLDPVSGAPNAPYAVGGGHMTNGATWIEQTALPLGVANSVLPALRGNNPKAMNYAFDGTRAAASILHSRSLFSDQVDQFLDDVGFDPVTNPHPAPSDALYVIEIGSNDVRDAVFAFLFLGNVPLALQIISDAGSAIGTEVQRLYNAGARNFLYVNAPPVLLAPALNTIPLPQPAVDFINFNLIGNLNAQLDGIFGGLPGVAQVRKLDLFALTHAVVGAPGTFGLTNATDACITPLEAPFICQVPDNYLFWDVAHPTKAGHAIIADEAAWVLNLH